MGPDFLAKGIPIIANAIGGMIEYTRMARPVWLNRSCTSEELSRIMQGVIEQSARVQELSTGIRARRASIIKPLARHAEEVAAMYAEVIDSHSEARTGR